MNASIKQRKINYSRLCSVNGCNAYSQIDSDKCAAHNGLLKRTGSITDVTISDDVVSMKKCVCQLAMGVIRGKIKPQVGNAAGKLIDLATTIEHNLEMQQRLEEMTKALEAYQDMGIENAELASLELENEYKDE